MFKLDPEWKQIAQKAWSFKFHILAAVFSGLEVAVQFMKPDMLPVSGGVFAGIAGGVSLVGSLARLLQQREVPNASPKAQ